MKKLSMLGIIGGAALLTAAPFSLQWSQKNVALSLDRARHLNRRPRSMNDAASAALAPQLRPPTRRQCPRASTTVNPVEVMRSHRQSPALTNNWG